MHAGAFITGVIACMATGLAAQEFHNVAPEQGLDFAIPSDLWGSGVSFYDIDGDGWDDLTFAPSGDSLIVYRNEQGTLVRLPSPIPTPGITKQPIWVDYDNDGVPDLFVTFADIGYRLYRNNGDFQFTDVTFSAGLATYQASTHGASWGDYDRDGHLDLYVCKYYASGTPGQYERLNKLYRNNGDGTFTDVTLTAGVSDGFKPSFQSAWFDHDRDGWPDLYVINDRQGYPNGLYRNNGDGTFTEVALEAGVAFPNDFPMTATVGDFDNDGDLDLYFTNVGFAANPCRLLVDQGDGTYTEAAPSIGAALEYYSWGATWIDLENDGWQDLFVATGTPPPYPQVNSVLLQGGPNGYFTDVSTAFADDPIARSFGVARGDLDNDGYYDIAVQNHQPLPAFLWKNSGGVNNHVKLSLQGTISNRMAIGSWMRVYVNGMCLTQYTHCGENYLGQNSQHHIFGIGQATTIDSVEVVYLSGHTDTYHDLAINTHHYLTEGETYTATIAIIGDSVFCAGGSVTLDAGEHEDYLWNNGHTERFLTVNASGTFSVTVQNPFGIQATSSQVTIVVNPQPFIVPQVTHPSCAGNADGSISLTNITGVPASEVLWVHGATGPDIAGLASGSYSYFFTDVNGCQANGSATLSDPAELFVQWGSTPEVEGEDGTLQLFVFGGTPPYTITLNGTLIGLFTSGLSGGQYDLVVTDANGCAQTFPVTIDSTTGSGSLAMASIQLHPNPASQVVYLSGMGNGLQLLVVDGSGKVLMHIPRAMDGPLDVGGLPSGTCLFRFNDVDGRAHVRTVVIAH